MLPDGTYDALIVDAADGRLEVTITTGDHKGEVVMLRGSFPGRDDIDLLAEPATLTVTDGVPRLRLG